MKKIGVSTVFTGYNYGSALQALAVKKIIEKAGFEPVLLSVKSFGKHGRDIRIKKLLNIGLRMVFNPFFRKYLKIYGESFKKPITNNTKEKFNLFQDEYLAPLFLSERRLKKIATDPDFKAFFCGSDQIWNASAPYVDPFYYLKFAPPEKRIAFAPSFGRNFIPEFNKKKIAKYLNGIDKLSVREGSGAEIIFDLTAKRAEVLTDPTLLLTAEEWDGLIDNPTEIYDKPYILLYFLDKPTPNAINTARKIAAEKGFDLVCVPYKLFDGLDCETTDAGPKEFVQLIKEACAVFTDSYHGAAFSINFHRPFFVFERKYGSADNQSSRIKSLLKITGFENRFEPDENSDPFEIAFSYSDGVLEQIRAKATEFIQKSLPF